MPPSGQAALRRQHPALSRGIIRVVESRPDLLVYARQHGDDRALVAAINSRQEISVEVNVPFAEGTMLVPAPASGGSDRLAVKDGRVTLHLRPVETLIWLARHDISTMSPSDGPSVSWSAP